MIKINFTVCMSSIKLKVNFTAKKVKKRNFLRKYIKVIAVTKKFSSCNIMGYEIL